MAKSSLIALSVLVLNAITSITKVSFKELRQFKALETYSFQAILKWKLRLMPWIKAKYKHFEGTFLSFKVNKWKTKDVST